MTKFTLPFIQNSVFKNLFTVFWHSQDEFNRAGILFFDRWSRANEFPVAIKMLDNGNAHIFFFVIAQLYLNGHPAAAVGHLLHALFDSLADQVESIAQVKPHLFIFWGVMCPGVSDDFPRL